MKSRNVRRMIKMMRDNPRYFKEVVSEMRDIAKYADLPEGLVADMVEEKFVENNPRRYGNRLDKILHWYNTAHRAQEIRSLMAVGGLVATVYGGLTRNPEFMGAGFIAFMLGDNDIKLRRQHDYGGLKEIAANNKKLVGKDLSFRENSNSSDRPVRLEEVKF